MSHGYKCDRCDTFVEQDDFGSKMVAEHGATERVDVASHPPNGDGEELPVYKWTLCERCRMELVGWVENFDLGEQGLADR